MTQDTILETLNEFSYTGVPQDTVHAAVTLKQEIEFRQLLLELLLSGKVSARSDDIGEFTYFPRAS